MTGVQTCALPIYKGAKFLKYPYLRLWQLSISLVFLVILPLYFFASFFCCPRHVSRCMCSFEHMSLLDRRISTLHLISLNNRNSPLSSWIFSTLLSFPQSSPSLPQSSPRYTLFLNLLFLSLSLSLPQSSPLFLLSFIFLFLNLFPHTFSLRFSFFSSLACTSATRKWICGRVRD